MNNHFCEKCRDYVECHIEEVDKVKEIKGTVINFRAKIAYCLECNNEVFVSELRDENLKNLSSNYIKRKL